MVFILCVVLRVIVHVIRVARARLQAGGALLFRREAALCNAGVRAMSVCLPCFANMHACLHAGGASIPPRIEFTLSMLCRCCVMMGTNKQAQWFGPTLGSVLAQSETAGERVVRNSAAWSRSAYVYWRRVHIMGVPLVHDIALDVCVVCALVRRTTVQ